ncbi:MAG: hypothetical protein JSW26_23270 [Desulfobacterales bacterium]|nr:MAG: hypothetical protein JSW26_23270 [Desulfobacterales bacterium]
MAPISHAVTLEELRSRLPDQIVGWSSKTEDRIYTPQTIFGYIDGGAEVYNAYNMKHCLSRRYTTPEGPAIVLDIFDMGSSEDAYGVFTHDLEGEPVDLGQDGRLRPGWLSFWKDRYFVSIYAEEEAVSAQNAVRMLAKQIDLIIPGRGAKPEILKLLPPEGLQSESLRYLHHPIILNYHYYIADQNLLNLSPQTDALLAGYQREEGQALMLLVSYPDATAADRAHANFTKHYLSDADPNGMALLENKKWAAAKVRERLLMIVLEADSRQMAESLLNSVR